MMITEEGFHPTAAHATVAIPLKTYFAPAGRDTDEELRLRHLLLESSLMLKATIDAMPSLVVILNSNRQAVSANQALLDFLGEDLAAILGKRPGEIIGCVQPCNGPDGCGTARGCMTCGAVNAILDSQKNHSKCTRECRVTLRNGTDDAGAMDLRVTAKAMDVEGERFTLCTIEDIQDEKRLKVLKQAFFHDVLNTASGIYGYSEILADTAEPASQSQEFLVELNHLTEQLIDEIQSQRDLMCAEAGDLKVVYTPLQTFDLLTSLQTLYSKHEVAKERIIDLLDLWQGQLVTDQRLLKRVLGNLLKNALEATEPCGRVVIQCTEQDDDVVFKVHNPSVMSEEVRLQIFQRSFSTKAQSGRGIGTYSIKLLTERYLGGKVDFRSETGEGTVFSVTIPKVPPRK